MRQPFPLLPAVISMALSLAACATRAPEPAVAEWTPSDRPCASLVGEYADAGEASVTNPIPGRAGRAWTAAEVFGLATAEDASAGKAEGTAGTLLINRIEGTFTLVIGEPHTELDGRCEGTELLFASNAQYESGDGKQVTRRRLRLSAYEDAEGDLVLRRATSERPVALVVAPGTRSVVEFYRFKRRVPPR